DAGRRAIFALDLTTGATRQLTDGAGRDDDPVWSPDGQFIAFDSDRDGDGMFDVFVLNVATGEIHRVTDEDGNDVAPAWQPGRDRKSTRLNSSHVKISYAVFCLKKKNITEL